jgi:microcystin-dependent protein
MAYFKSDLIDAVSTYSYIPTGGIVTIAGAFSEYSDSSYVTLGLIPCDGRTLNGSASPEYSNLFSVIDILYGGTGITSFLVPNLKTNKVAIAGTSNTFYNVNTVGTKLTSVDHYHTSSATNSDFTLNSNDVTHNHDLTWGSASVGLGANTTSTIHAHSFSSGSVGVIGPNVFKNGAAGTSGGGLNGNHTHNTDITSGNAIGGGSTASHEHSGADTHAMGANTADSHTHTASVTTSSATNNTTYSSSAIGIPYANVLYFIKA